jgi:hypothetical protein
MTDFKVGDYIQRIDGAASDVCKVTLVRVVYHGHDREGRDVTYNAPDGQLIRLCNNER